MSSRDLVSPRLPTAPTEYDISYMTDLVRALEVFIQQETNPGEARATKLTLTQLPTSDTGLEAGALYRLGNQVFISLIDIGVPDSLSAAGSVGSVTVVTT